MDRNNNSGYYNSGYYNSGYRNSGNYNSGDCNSGNYNSGHYNSGNYNSGNYNSGDYNSGHYNSGFFNTTTPALRLFNKDTGLTMDDLDIPFIDLKINEWKNEKELTNEDKKNSVKWDVNKGVLITRSYHEAWKL